MKKKRIWILLAALFLFMQLFQIDKSVPEVDPFEDFLTTTSTSDDASMPKSLIQKACYDCHSYKTEYPWYALFAPVSWWLKGHVKGGRQHLNFSIWQRYDLEEKKHKLEESIEEIQGGNMPLKSYIWLHKEAKLTDDERAHIMAFLRTEIANTK